MSRFIFGVLIFSVIWAGGFAIGWLAKGRESEERAAVILSIGQKNDRLQEQLEDQTTAHFEQIRAYSDAIQAEKVTNLELRKLIDRTYQP